MKASTRLKIVIGASAVVVLVAVGVICFHPDRILYMRQQRLELIAPDGTHLRGTLSMPRWRNGPFPGVVVVHGSGRLAREHVRGDVRQLVWEGFAVLSYDKRGVGESGGEYPRAWGPSAEATLRQLAGDAAAAVAQLRQHSEVDPTSVGLFGASQASWIIPLAAQMVDPAPRFQVILSGAAVSTGVEQFYSDLTGDGSRAPQVQDPKEIERLVLRFDGEVGFDPRSAIAAMRGPTLWILGDRDQSVPVFATVMVLESLHPDVAARHTVVRFPNAGHDLRDVTSGESVPIWDAMREWMGKVGVTDAVAK